MKQLNWLRNRHSPTMSNLLRDIMQRRNRDNTDSDAGSIRYAIGSSIVSVIRGKLKHNLVLWLKGSRFLDDVGLVVMLGFVSGDVCLSHQLLCLPFRCSHSLALRFIFDRISRLSSVLCTAPRITMLFLFGDYSRIFLFVFVLSNIQQNRSSFPI